MAELEIIDGIISDRESPTLEFKNCRGKLSKDFWPTYSAFANTFGGIIYLGVEDGTQKAIGVDDPEKIVKEVWDLLNDRKKVSANILSPEDISIIEVDGVPLVRVHVLRAERSRRPVYINGSMDDGSYKRNGEGDYHCSQADIAAMLRDASEDAQDSVGVDGMMIEDLDRQTVESFRRRMASMRPHHPWASKDDGEFLRLVGAATGNESDGYTPTLAGLLMFGMDCSIMQHLPNYHLDYLEYMGSGGGWTRRITTGEGEFPGNIYSFLMEVAPRISAANDNPKEIDGMFRVDDTQMMKCQRELLVNALVHADYRGHGGVRAEWHRGWFSVRNPGGLRIPLEMMMGGGFSDPRNPHIAVMLSLIGLVERTGSGVCFVADECRRRGIGLPEYTETADPRTVTVRLETPPAASSDASPIKAMMAEDGSVTIDDISNATGMGRSKVMRIVTRMKESGEIERIGGTRGRWVVRRR